MGQGLQSALRELLPNNMDKHISKAWDIGFKVISTKMLHGDEFDHTSVIKTKRDLQGVESFRNTAKSTAKTT